MQGSKSEFFQKSTKQHKHFDDGTGKRRDNRKFNTGNQKREKNQKQFY